MAKIGIIISSLYACGGEERVVSLMANEWAKDHEVVIYTYENRETEENNRNDYFLSDSIRVERINDGRENIFSRVIKLLYYYTGLTKGSVSQILLRYANFPPKTLERWENRLNKNEFDFVIGVSGTYTMLLGLLKNKITAKTIGWEHSSYEGYFAKGKGYLRNQETLFSKYTSKLNACIVLNEDIQRKYKENLGLETTVIYNPRSFVSREKVDCGKQCFVTCGRLEAEKGYDDLITAFHHFSETNPEWKLLIIGGGSLHEKLERMAEAYGISNKVTITGYVHNVSELLRRGSVFVMTSRWEGFPMTITEALEMGLPVIAYDIPAMQPLITDGMEGKIVPAFENAALVKAMKELAGDADMRKRMSEAAARKAELFSEERIADRWSALFNELGYKTEV